MKDITNMFNKMGLMKEHVSLVTDKEIYKQLNYGKLAAPSIHQNKSDQIWDELHYKQLNHFSINQTIFLQIDDVNARSDITVFPLQISVSFYAAFMLGP
jgi:hypothetical protein